MEQIPDPSKIVYREIVHSYRPLVFYAKLSKIPMTFGTPCIVFTCCSRVLLARSRSLTLVSHCARSLRQNFWRNFLKVLVVKKDTRCRHGRHSVKNIIDKYIYK